MADLLPSIPDTSAAEDAEPRVLGLDSDEADDVLSALSSATARELLAALHDNPAPPSKLADRVDTSLQNAQYHLEKLEDADVIEVVDTAYSEKGREMDVYAPTDQPLVVFAGSEEESTGLRAALSRLLGGLGILAVGSVLVQRLAESGAFGGATGGPAGGDGGPAGGDGGDDIQPASDDGAAGGGNASEETLDGGTDTGREYETAEGDTVGAADSTGTPAPEATDATSAPTATPAETPADTPVPEPATTEPATTTEAVNTTTPDGTTEAAGTVIDAAGIEPGLLFFAGGAFVLTLAVAVWYLEG